MHWTKHFLVRLFLVCLLPAPGFLSKHSHSDHKTPKTLLHAAIAFLSISIQQTPSWSLVFMTQQKNLSSAQPQPAALSSYIFQNMVTPTNLKKPSHLPANLPCAAEATWLHSTISYSTRSKPVQLFKELFNYSSSFYHELQQHLSAKTQRDRLLLPYDRQQAGGDRTSSKHGDITLYTDTVLLLNDWQ